MGLLDASIAATFPTVQAPREGMLEPAAKNGTRYVVAVDGLWREITLPWIRVVHKIADADIRLPYGQQRPVLEVLCGPVPKDLRHQFLRDARQAMPHEMAAAMIWNVNSGAWRYEMRVSTEATHAHVRYKEVGLAEGECLVLDLHSHAKFDAFFSKEDDADDAGSMRFSGVIGSLSEDNITSALRLNMLGKTWDANFASDGKLEVDSCR